MLGIRTLSSLALSMAVAGCSIHPLPKNVTRDTTLEIINKIRCEARDAIIDRILEVLKEPNSNRHVVSSENLALLRKFESQGSSEKVFYDTSIDEADLETAKRLHRFSQSSITYTFLFTISENKVKSGAATFTMPFTKGTFTLGLSAGSNKTRANERTITLQDTFSSLVTGVNHKNIRTGLDCDDVDKPRNHWIYPITGKIGLAEVVNTFIDVERASGTVTSYADKLTFTTVFNAGANPSVMLDSPLSKHFKLTKASASYSAKRSDAHEVKLVFAKPGPGIVVKEILFTPFLVEGEKLEGMPSGSEFGLAVRRKKKKTKDSRKITTPDGMPFLPSPAFVPQGQRMFIITPNAAESSLRRGLSESYRLESVERGRKLDRLP